MIETKKYKVVDGVTERQFVNCGFKARSAYYIIKRSLYDNKISLNLLIDKEDHYMVINVSDESGALYAPFYNPADRHDNLVYEAVAKEFNKIMDELVKKHLLAYDNDDDVPKDSKTIKVKYHADISKIEKINKGDWIDLRAAQTVKMKAGEFRLISLGVSMKLPEGYEAHIVPRSSTYKNFGIIQTNHMGIIDETYSGTNDVWKFPAYATRDTVIKKNDRICQFRIMEHQPTVVFQESDTLDDVDRGGFGSTGKR